jgi:hypothetical protein
VAAVYILGAEQAHLLRMIHKHCIRQGWIGLLCDCQPPDTSADHLMVCMSTMHL